MGNRGRRYSQNFKAEAICDVQENNVTITVAAKTLNVRTSTTPLNQQVPQAEVDVGNAKKGEHRKRIRGYGKTPVDSKQDDAAALKIKATS